MRKNIRIINFNVKKQSGAALFISLMMLLALTIIGLSAANRSNLQERMASNYHMQNVAFNAAESAISAFIVETFTGDKLDPAHVLFNLRIAGSLNNNCYDSAGVRHGCGGVYFDDDRSSAITSQVDVEVQQCNRKACGGFSLGEGSSLNGCRIYQVNGTGTVGTKSESSSLWAYEITACMN